MSVYVLWHGGANYSGSDMNYLEKHDSLETAIGACTERMTQGDRYRQFFPYVNQPEADVHTPCVDESSTMYVYLSDPSDSEDPYPDFIIEWDGWKFVANPA